jgi:NitT/TauT family transport system permease protein/taurine transport system permease protein/sulfonate transport system permease protein
MARKRWRPRRATVDRIWQGGLAVAAFVGVWHVASVTGLFGRIDPDYSLLLLPPPGVVVKALYDLAVTGQLWTNVAVSLVRVLIGFGLSVLIAVPLGLLMALSTTASNLFEPFVRIFSPIPGIAWVPLAILWFGLGDGAAVFIITIGSIFPILISTIQGVRDVDPRLIDAARMMGTGTRQTITRVILPGLVPYLVTGFRTGMGFAWRVVIAAEMVGVPKGIGYMLNVGRSTGQTEVTVVTMLLLGLMMLAVEELVFSPLEARTRAWRT